MPDLVSRFRYWIAALLAGGTMVGGGMMLASANYDVHIGATPTPTATPTATPSSANLWMDTNGGTCGRQSPAGAYSDAAACGDFDTAYANASCGDTIRLVDGSSFTGYTNFTGAGSNSEGLVDGPTKTCSGAQRVTFIGGSGVAAGGLDIANTSYMTFQNIAFGGETPANNDDKVIDLSNADHITFTDSTLDVGWKVTDGLGIAGSVQDFLWDGGSLCCNRDEKLIEIDIYDGSGTNQSDITFDGVDIGNQAFSNTDGSSTIDGGTVHAECFWLQQTTNFTIKNSVIHHCISTGAMNWGGDGLNQGLLFRNNVWGPAYDFGSTEVIPGATTGYRGSAVGTFIQGANTSGTGTIEYNVFEGLVTLSGWTSLTWRGNVDRQQTCGGAGYTYLYNLHVGADCSASDVQVSGVFSTSNFVSLGTNTTSGNYRPASGSAAQCGAGDPGSAPATDLLGTTRGSPADAGPYEC